MKRSKRNIVRINLIPKNPQHRQPGIYIHYYEGKVQYVGETVNVGSLLGTINDNLTKTENAPKEIKNYS